MKQLAVVTGANQGIGFEVCRKLAQRGFQVVLTSRDAPAGAESAARLVKEGYDVSHLALDVTDASAIDRVSDQLASRGVPIGALINNAGVSLHGFDSDVARATLAINFFGAWNVTRSLLPLMAEQGRIVMVSSAMGQLDCVSGELRHKLLTPSLSIAQVVDWMQEYPRLVEQGTQEARGWPSNAYRVSKVGLNALVRVLAREWRGERRVITAICPGWVKTRMGGASAPRTVSQGAESVVWGATQPSSAQCGGFFRDGEPIDW